VDASASSCVVLLPPLQTIIMDPVFGEVMISDSSLCGALSIKGSGCVIRPSSSTPLSMRLLNVDLYVPSDGWFSLHINNLVIMNFGNSSVEGGAVRLNNLKSNYLSSITNVIFRNNSGSHGGALAISNSETVVLRGNAFVRNTARGDAGGLFIDSDCENINITDSLFSHNTATGEVNSKSDSAGLGGGAMINTRNGLITLHNCSCFNNVAILAGGLGVYDSNDHISLTDIFFLNNTAERFGGGMYAVSDNLYLTLTRCYFLGNTGKIDSGGLRLQSDNFYMNMLQCTFSGNSASSSEGGEAYGGEVFMFSSNSHLMVRDCYFYDNICKFVQKRSLFPRVSVVLKQIINNI
jgi:predicted outer membrane repeat protein